MIEPTRLPPHRAGYGSDVIVDLLKAYNIQYVAFNPGASFRGVHESLVNYGNNTVPEVIQCCHEEVSVAMAHGYAKATGNPMAVIVHDTVGLLHASMAIFNAWCDRVPLIILGGNGPLDSTRRRPHVDWMHTTLVPNNLVRDFVKWDDQPFSIVGFPESFMRAYKLTMTPPRGPVFISCDVDLQEEVLSQQFTLPDIAGYMPPAPVQADPEALRQAARWLVEADNPVIIADYVYRNRRVAESLAELAELLAVPVVDSGRFSINLIPDHPLNAGGAQREILKQSDVILALDTPDLFSNLNIMDRATGTLHSLVSPNVRVIQISLAQLLVKSLACDYGGLQAIDLDILADTSMTLPILITMCRELIGQDVDKLEKYHRRFERVHSLHEELKSRWLNQVQKEKNELPIAVSRLCNDIGKVIRDMDWVLVNDDVRSWNQRLWEWSRPDQWIGWSGGGGLGYGIGGSMGAALAFKGSNRLCIDLQADGDFLYAPSALWTAAHHRIPLLIVMYNNRRYNNSEEHIQEIARARGRSESAKVIGNRIDQPSVDFARLAQSFGIYGEGPIENPEDVKPALERAVKIVMEKKVPALVDVFTGAYAWQLKSD